MFAKGRTFDMKSAFARSFHVSGMLRPFLIQFVRGSFAKKFASLQIISPAGVGSAGFRRAKMFKHNFPRPELLKADLASGAVNINSHAVLDIVVSELVGGERLQRIADTVAQIATNGLREHKECRGIRPVGGNVGEGCLTILLDPRDMGLGID